MLLVRVTIAVSCCCRLSIDCNSLWHIYHQSLMFIKIHIDNQATLFGRLLPVLSVWLSGWMLEALCAFDSPGSKPVWCEDVFCDQQRNLMYAASMEALCAFDSPGSKPVWCEDVFCDQQRNLMYAASMSFLSKQIYHNYLNHCEIAVNLWNFVPTRPFVRPSVGHIFVCFCAFPD